MKILFVIPTYKPAVIYGGTTVAISKLAESLVSFGEDVTVYTTTANGKFELDVETEKVQYVDGVKVYYYKRFTKDHSHFSPGFWYKVWRNATDFDIVHLHSWWSPSIMICAMLCWIKGVRMILSPHGMLSPYIFRANNGGIKKYYHNILGKHILSKTILHVSSEIEKKECLEIIPNWSISTILNIIELPCKSYKRSMNSVFTLGFLSRIDPKKGLDLLLNALSELDFEFKLKIAGDGKTEYINELKHLAYHLGISNKIEWIGWKNGDEKFDFLASLDLFTLTSHSENFAIVIGESLSVGTPVLTSQYVGLSDLVNKNNFGWVTNNQIDDIKQCLIDAYEQKEKRNRINIDAPAFIMDRFSENRLVKEYFDFYSSVILKSIN